VFDAALHDAYGKLQGCNVYDCYSSDHMEHDLGYYLDDRFKGDYLDQYTLRSPKDTIPLYHLVGAVDPVTPSDVEAPVGDGLPEHLGEWIDKDRLTHLKIKLNGDDLEWDVERVVAIDKVAEETQQKLGVSQWFYSLDFNEKCENAEYVLSFLNKVEEKQPHGLGRVQYIEQPTHRDLKSYPENKMHAVAKIKPVVIDESLIDYEHFLRAEEMGYSGVALKACKGQSSALLMGAAAQKFDRFLCVQDLTCFGASFLHSAGLAARVPTVAAIEGNGRQYLPPAAYQEWVDRYPEAHTVKNGTIRTGVLTGPGLGH
jgi:L-alanine-DL-glutamate epimerase-like enolase superfamily enzyme